VVHTTGGSDRSPKIVADLAAQAEIDQVLALTDTDNVRSQAVAARPGMRDESLTSRWFGLTTRQYRKTVRPRARP